MRKNLFLLVLCGWTVEIFACTGLIAGRGVTKTGFVIAAHNEDNSSPHFVRHALLPSGATAWYAEPGRAALPPPERSLACFWSEVKSPDGNPQPGDLFFNEKGVLVYSNNGGVCAKWGDDEWSLPDEGEASTLTDGGLGHNLRFAVARQATSAREGVSIMTNLISRYGYANRSRMFTIADRNEAWHVQVVQGRRFVARRCPDGALAAYPNALTIERVEPGDLFSANLRPGAPFIAAYQGPRTWKSDYNFYRWREVYRLVAGVEPERGEVCPFSLVPRQKVEARTIKRALSSHFEGEACAPVSKHLPDEKPDRKPTVCRRTTIESSICIFGATPEETVLLLATGRPCETAYFAAKPFGGVLPPDTVTGDAAVRRLREHQLSARKEPLQIETERQFDIPYVKTDDLYRAKRCRLDLRVPRHIDGFKTLIWFHGGGLDHGRAEFVPLQDPAIAQVSVEYRVHTADHPVPGDEILRDGAAAVAWVLEHIADYGGDPKSVYLAGISAGGYITYMVGMAPWLLKERGHSNLDLKAIIPFSGQVTKHFNVRRFEGDLDPQYRPKLDRMSPLSYVDNRHPPILAICGQPPYEWVCRAEENRFLVSSSRACGNQAWYLELPMMDHDGTVRSGVAYLEQFMKMSEWKDDNPFDVVHWEDGYRLSAGK